MIYNYITSHKKTSFHTKILKDEILITYNGCHWKWIHQLIRLPAYYPTNSAVGLSWSCWTGLFNTNVSLLDKIWLWKSLETITFFFLEAICLSVTSMNRLLMIEFFTFGSDQKLRLFGFTFKVSKKLKRRLQKCWSIN